MSAMLTPQTFSANGLLPVLLLFSATLLYAQTQNNRGITLPDSYRTPLSDMVYENHTRWRAPAEAENPWRDNDEEPMIKSRIRVQLFPKYNYDSLENPNPGSLFQNENEIDKPVSNIFRYDF